MKYSDKIIFEDFYIRSKDSENVCLHAFASMVSLLLPFIHCYSAIELGIGRKENVGYVQCLDPGPPHTDGGTVTFQLIREAIGDNKVAIKR